MTYSFRSPGPPRVASRVPAAPTTVRAEVGVLTVLPVEMRAVVAALKRMYDYGDRRLGPGSPVHEAWLPDSRGRPVRVAAVQAPRPGPESAARAFRALIEEYRPATVVLTGLAGGVGAHVAPGDVVLSDRLVTTRLPPGARRVQGNAAAATLGYRLDDFLTAVPLVQERGNGDSFRLHRGPIGSGGVPVEDARAEIRRWLTQVNDQVLAVETEAVGVARAFHEGAGNARGRLIVRGIADTAYQRKGDDHRELAARHAAEVTAMLVPFLHPAR
jgi:adenosylhomocysteine nucleosidase